MARKSTPASNRDTRPKPRNPNRSSYGRDGEVSRSALPAPETRSEQRIVLIDESVEYGGVDPGPLHEFELPLQVGAQGHEQQPLPTGPPVAGRRVGIRPTASQHAVAVGDSKLVHVSRLLAAARIGPADVRTERTREVVGGRIDSRPRISLHMTRQGHRPTDDERRLAEVARLALADERPILGDELQQLLVRKFANPIVGIMGAHLLILGEERGQILDPRLLNDVVRNLRALFGEDHPDVEAISVRCKDETLRTRQIRISRPPMFERSWRLLVEASYVEPRLLSDRLVAQMLAPSALPPFLVWAKDDATRQAALSQLRGAVWAERSPGEIAVGAGPPPLQQSVASAAKAFPNPWRAADLSPTRVLSRSDRSDRKLARQRASGLSLPSNAFRSILDRDDPTN